MVIWVHHSCRWLNCTLKHLVTLTDGPVSSSSWQVKDYKRLESELPFHRSRRTFWSVLRYINRVLWEKCVLPLPMLWNMLLNKRFQSPGLSLWFLSYAQNSLKIQRCLKHLTKWKILSWALIMDYKYAFKFHSFGITQNSSHMVWILHSFLNYIFFSRWVR